MNVALIMPNMMDIIARWEEQGVLMLRHKLHFLHGPRGGI